MASAKESWRDQLDQDLDCLRECTYVEEADEISLLIRHTVESQGLDAQIAYSRFRKIVGQLALLCFHKCKAPLEPLLDIQ